MHENPTLPRFLLWVTESGAHASHWVPTASMGSGKQNYLTMVPASLWTSLKFADKAFKGDAVVNNAPHR